MFNQLAISKRMSDSDRHLFAVICEQQSSHVPMFALLQLTLKHLELCILEIWMDLRLR